MMQCMEAPTMLYLICTASVRKDLRSSSHCFDQHPPLIRLFNIRMSRTSSHGLQLLDLVITNSPKTVLLLWETTVRKAHYCRETKNVTFPMKYTQVYPEETQRRKWQMGCAGWLKCHLVQNDIDDDDLEDVSMGVRRQKNDLIWTLLIQLRPTSTNDCFHALTLPPRSCQLWFSSAPWCPCSTTLAWCSGSLERYWDLQRLGDKCTAAILGTKS